MIDATKSAAPASPPAAALYDVDLARWFEVQTAALASGAWDQVDVPNIIEELNGLAGSDRRELRNRIQTAFEHMLKLVVMPNDDAARGWRVTVRNSVREIAHILKQSPSLGPMLHDPDTIDEAFADAREDVETLFEREIDSNGQVYFMRLLEMLLQLRKPAGK